MDTDHAIGAPEDLKPGEPAKVTKEYTDIIQSQVEVADPETIKDTGKAANIIFFCRNCEKIVPAKRIGQKLRFSCPECKKENIALGTEKSILSHYRIKESKP